MPHVKSLNTHRLHQDLGNFMEIALFQLWKKEEGVHQSLVRQRCADNDPNACGVDINGMYALPIGDLDEDKEIFMATVVQWMGSPCGQSFLNEARCLANSIEEEYLIKEENSPSIGA